MNPHAVIAIVIFVVTYGLILSNRVDKTVAALLGGSLMIVFHVVGEVEAYAYVDLSVIFLLVGMMIISHFLAESGLFGFAAVWIAQLVHGRPVPLLVLLALATGVLSALVDNVTTVVLIAPVTFLMADQLEISPVPFLLFEVMAANIGGTATLIGDPPNILIGSSAGLTFNQFLFHLGPPAAFCLLLLLILAAVTIHRYSQVSTDVRARIMDMNAARAITDRVLLIKSGSVLVVVLTCFMLHELIHVGPAPIALVGAGVLLLITRSDPVKAFQAVEWPTLFFFVGLFLTVAGLVSSGVIERMSQGVLHLTGTNLAINALAVLWFAGLSSAFVGAIPMVTALIPILNSLMPAIEAGSGADPQMVEYAMWWSLALGACMGANGTILGAAANIVVVEIARNNNRVIPFGRFMLVGMPIAVTTLVLCSGYVLVRYVW